MWWSCSLRLTGAVADVPAMALVLAISLILVFGVKQGAAVNTTVGLAAPLGGTHMHTNFRGRKGGNEKGSVGVLCVGRHVSSQHLVRAKLSIVCLCDCVRWC